VHEPIQNEVSGDLPLSQGNKANTVQFGSELWMRRSRSEGSCPSDAGDFMGICEENASKSIKWTPPITISVRPISYADVGQMRVRRHRPGSRHQDKDLG
jgi:hypothetical protein